MKNGREFLFAIKESTHTVFDKDAEEYLDVLVEGISGAATAQGLTGPERDAVIFFEGMLKGVQLQLTRDEQRETKRLFDLGLLDPDKKPKGDA